MVQQLNNGTAHSGSNARTAASSKKAPRTSVTVQTPVNIALIKYWGKKDEELMLPLNDSISVTINALCAISTVTASHQLSEDEVQLNGRAMNVGEGTRYHRVFNELRRLIQGGKNYQNGGTQNGSNSVELNGDSAAQLHIQVISTTNFPTSAGLASSAAGYAAIACGLGRIFHLPLGEVARLARLGSGSACRSVAEGFVQWKAPSVDGSENHAHHGGKNSIAECDSIAVLSASRDWPQLRAVILVLSAAEKAVGSTEGMRESVRTSSLLASRVRNDVPRHVVALCEALRARDFSSLATITMAESDQLHAVCEDTKPPIRYLNDDSRRLIDFVRAFNEREATAEKPRLAYTFDAGPNCFLLMEAHTLPAFYVAFEWSFQLPANIVSMIRSNQAALMRGSGGGAPLRQRIAQRPRLNIVNLIESEVGGGPIYRDYGKVAKKPVNGLSPT